MAETVIGALSVKITADTEGVKKGLKSTGEALKIGGKQLRASANQWGKWALVATAAAAGVAAAFLKSNLATIKELKNTAQAADTQVAAFQRGAFAANSVGISTEKYGDILKDVNDRVGDFLISGAGPMVDFFEVIAPKIGITADAFKNLSGQESLGLYIKSLQEAGVSQQEMTFFMEALASDSTRLTPLFQDNAKAFRTLTKEAESLGIGLSDIDVAKATLASAELAKAAGIIEAMDQQLTTELAPILAAVTELFVNMAKNAGGSSQFIQKSMSGVVNVIGVFADGLRGIEIIFKGLEVAAIGFSALAVSVFQGVTNTIATSIDGWVMIVNGLVVGINDALGLGIDAIPQVRSSSFIKSVNEVGNNMRNLVGETNAELHALLMQPLPSSGIKEFVTVAVTEFEKLAVAKAKALGNEKVDGEGVGTKKTSEIELFEAETIGLLEALGLRFQSQEEMELAHLTREREQLKVARANGEIGAIQHSERMAEIKQSEEDIKRQITLQGVQQGFKILTGGNKKIAKAMEVAAKIQAAIKGGQAAVDAFQAGMSVGGPFAPITAAAYAAASIATTASMIASIGKSGGGSKPSGGLPATPTGSFSGSGSGSSNSQPQADRNVTVRFVGSSAITAFIRDEIIPGLNEALGDGVNIGFEGT